ncbi:hypothetical protein EDC04DRAFT_2900836 [Pisolithus marmoratus]|nr:hypothetical protein EDC04DRAFT_2900836 [Pisolithus marmoratus]
MITHLESNDPTRLTPSIYRKYTEIAHEDYLRVIAAYDEMHAIPNLVHLVCKGARLDTRHFPTGWHIEQLKYSGLDEIPVLLASPLIAARSSRSVDFRASVPRPRILPRMKPADDQVDLSPGVEPSNVCRPIKDAQGLPSKGDQSVPAVVAVDEEQFSLRLVQCDQEGQVELSLEDEPAKANEPIEDVDDPADDDEAIPAIVATDEEVSAVHLIQRVYRQYRQKQKGRLKRTALEAEKSALFSACLKHAQACRFAPGFYSLLYLGPLPHLLLALKKGINTATSIRNVTKIPTLLLREGHECLEELGRKRSEISSILKQGHDLLKKLSPDSQFHKNRDIGALKDAVLQVKAFLHRIPGGERGAAEELNVAYKAIVTEKHVPKKEKPSVNAEDLDPY